ncbi:M24 family metallopeptidase [Nonomuraea sediminis]|uniref:M24 family metallopeptidase n=1 Tax=Nonomuraea sediminis TaxID=2835864 RepID=UPI001BDD1BF4|nr:Xaa-Pro peptidase family protein [Nonomuraea sediminis]
MTTFADFIRAEEERLADRPRELPFDREEYSGRLAALRARMAGEGIDALVLSSPDGMCWLDGYDGRWYRSHSGTAFPPAQCTLVTADGLLMIESESHEQLVRLTSCVEDFHGVSDTVTLEEYTHTLATLLRGHETVGVERWSSVPNPATLGAVEEALKARGHRVVDATGTVRLARRLKSPAEIALVERAQAAADAGTRELHRHVRAGMTELEAWSVYMAGMIAAGGEPSAMHETVAAGPAMPMLHGVSTRRALRPGDHFHLDAAAAVHRYHARATRPFVLGEPPAELAALAVIVAGAHDVLTATARPGRPFRELNKALREYFADAGVEGWAGGYELGVSFPPDWVGEFLWSCDDDTDAVIEPGLVTNFESCAYLAMVDTVVFDDQGARLLSSLPRELMVGGS